MENKIGLFPFHCLLEIQDIVFVVADKKGSNFSFGKSLCGVMTKEFFIPNQKRQKHAFFSHWEKVPENGNLAFSHQKWLQMCRTT